MKLFQKSSKDTIIGNIASGTAGNRMTKRSLIQIVALIGHDRARNLCSEPRRHDLCPNSIEVNLMKATPLTVLFASAALFCSSISFAQTTTISAGEYVRKISPSGSVSLASAESNLTPTSPASGANSFQKRLQPSDRFLGQPGPGVATVAGQKAKSNPEVDVSFSGLDVFDSYVANGFEEEPPDQGLCAANGFVLESVNSAVRIYDSLGNPASKTVALNAFYGLPPRIDSTTGKRGPIAFDPSCHYDADTKRWFHLVSSLERAPGSNRLSGKSHLDLAVSQTSDPRGSWTIYQIPAQNDGTDGTPNHGCSFGPCFPDFPHIAADANGIYISTNEYSFFGPEYKSANIYALSKRQLVLGGPLTIVLLETPQSAAGGPGFTVLGALSAPGQFNTDNGGTEFFLSSDAALETGNTTGTSGHLLLWALMNTSSLDAQTPSLSLSSSIVPVNPYSIPPQSDQKNGDVPLGVCMSQDCFGFGFTVPFQGPGPMASGVSEVTRVYYANGKLWSTVGTGVSVNGATKAGIEWFILNPGSQKVYKEGYLALAGNNLIFPAAAATASGRGVLTFTITGPDYYPSAGYVSLDGIRGAGDIHIVAYGVGPQDGLTEYFPPPRWGDYSAAVVDGNDIWIGSEIIAQTCTFQEFLNDPTCGATRAPLANWSTHLTRLTP